MRLFVAIEISDEVCGRIEKVRRRLAKETALPRGAVKWVEPENTHLTLVFLGEVADQQIMDVCAIVDEVCASHRGFEMEVKGLGTFGKPVRVVWAGITDNPALKALQRELNRGFEVAGWPVENRGYAGHLTLCRVKLPAAGDMLRTAIIPIQDEAFGTSFADSVCVFESHLSGGGPTYTAVHRRELK
jgi:2'-5' RNA ligase